MVEPQRRGLLARRAGGRRAGAAAGGATLPRGAAQPAWDEVLGNPWEILGKQWLVGGKPWDYIMDHSGL